MNYNFSLYILHQLFGRLLYTELYFQSPLFICFILFSGIIAGLNPCTLSILPLLLSYLNIDSRSLINYFFFIFGVLSLGLTLGIIVSIIGYRYYILSVALPLLSAILFMFIGLIVLQVLPFNIWTTVSLHSKLLHISNIHLKYFVFGGLLAINTLPCTLPIALTVFNMLLAVDNFSVLFLYSILYSLGYICPILFFYSVIEQIRKLQVFKVFTISRWYVLFGGSFLLTFGVFKFLRLTFW